MADLYAYFIEKGVSLHKDKGIFGYIVANKWMRANYGEPLRKWLKRQCIAQIVDFGDLPVFQQATTYPCILVIGKGEPPSAFVAAPDGLGLQPEPNILVQSKMVEPARSAKKPTTTFSVTQVKTLEFESLEGYVKENRHSVKLSILDDTGWSLADERSATLLNKLKKAGNTSDAWNWFCKSYPSIANHLSPFADAAKKRYDKGDYWWELRACEYYGEFEKPKIIVPAIAQRASYMLDNSGFYSNDKTSIIATDDLNLLGILNSKVSDFVVHSISSTKQGGYFEYKPMYVSQIPIRTINFSDPDDKARLHLLTRCLNSTNNLPLQGQTTKRPLSSAR